MIPLHQLVAALAGVLIANAVFHLNAEPPTDEVHYKEDPPAEPVLREEVRVGDYLARRYDVGWESRIELAPVTKPELSSFVLTGHRLRLGREQDGGRFGLGEDLNGDGVPELIISEWSGGAHCCMTDYMISLADHPRVLDTIHGRHSDPWWADLDGDGRPEVAVHDWTFAYWATSFAGSPAPEVILTWRAGRYRPAEALMVAPPPSEEELADLAAWILAAPEIDGPDGVGILMAEVLRLLYSGARDQAWRLFELGWSPSFGEDRARFVTDFRTLLEGSPYWAEIKHFNSVAGP